MNPNLQIFFKRTFYVISVASVLALLYYFITRFVQINYSAIGEYLMQGLLGLMMVLMVGLVGGLLIRSIWGGIMNRADTIVLCCPDMQYDGVHIVASHYNPGGESGEGFSNHFHYYLNENGKLFLSKKVKDDGSDITKSIAHLSEQTRMQLNPAKEHGVSIGSNTNGDNKPVDVVVRLRKGELRFRGYEAWIDYGFKISYNVNGQEKWRVRI